MSLLNDISLGVHFFKIAKILREAMLINGMLFCADVWYNVSEQNLRKMEKIDESLLRKIINAHSKTAIEALYLELGCFPIRFHLMSKRVNYLHYILNFKKSDLLSKFFEAQSKNPTKGDWILQVIEDLNSLGISTDFDKIRKYKKNTFKNLVKEKTKSLALKYLNN